MAKFLVKRNDVRDDEATADRVLAGIEAIVTELSAELGTDTTEKGKTIARVVMEVDPAKRKELLAKLAFVSSAIMADTSGIARGREPIANMDHLQVVYVECKAAHPGVSPKVLAKWVASTYNKRYANTPEFEVDSAYVQKYAKAKGWDQLPAAAPAVSE